MNCDITFHPKWWHKNAGIDFSEPFFTNARYRMECDVKMRRTLYEHFGQYGLGEKAPELRPILGTDLLAAGYLHSQILGCKVEFSPDNSPQVLCANLSEEQVENFKSPCLEANPVFQNLKDQAEFLKREFGHVEACVNLMGVQNIALDLMGQELFVAYYTEPDLMYDFLGEITSTVAQIGTYLWNLNQDCSGGVTAIIRKMRPKCYLTSNCSVEMISQELYESFLLPCDQSLAAHFGAFGIHHCGGTMEHVVEAYAKVGSALKFVEAGAGSDVGAVRRALPDITLNARYSPAALRVQSERDIEKQVEALALQGRGTAGGAFSISCVGLDDAVSDEAIGYFLNACRQI